MKKQRISIFLPSLRGGGAERIMINLARGFSEQGIDVDLVVAKLEGAYMALVPKGVNVVNLNVKRVLFTLIPLSRYIMTRNPKAIISTMDHCNLISIFAKRISRKRNLKLLLTVHSTPSQVIKNSKNFKTSFLIPFLLKKEYRKQRKVIAVSKGVADDMCSTYKIPKENVHVIYNPVIDSDIFYKANENLNHEWFSNRNIPVILGVGRLASPKDFSTLIKAFALVRKERKARLIILGEGPMRENLNMLIGDLNLEEDVQLLGFCDNPYYYFSRAAVYVLSSYREGLPTALIEALALGCNVVATNCKSGPSEILEEGKLGKLIPIGKESIMAKAIMKALDQEKNSMNDTVFEKYSIEAATKKYLSEIEVR